MYHHTQSDVAKEALALCGPHNQAAILTRSAAHPKALSLWVPSKMLSEAERSVATVIPGMLR